MKKGVVVLFALAVGFSQMLSLGAQARKTEPGYELVNVCLKEYRNQPSTRYTVPSDRRLTIEDATLQTYLRAGESLFGDLVTWVNGEVASTTVALLVANSSNFYSAGRMVKIYADPGTTVDIAARTSVFTPDYAQICFSGRLDPLP
jgi:hypothetical protein